MTESLRERTEEQAGANGPDDDLWDDLFTGCAWAAFAEEAALCNGIPSTEAVRWRAYRYYEEALRGEKKPGPLRTDPL